jgi:hypothetical protein
VHLSYKAKELVHKAQVLHQLQLIYAKERPRHSLGLILAVTRLSALACFCASTAACTPTFKVSKSKGSKSSRALNLLRPYAFQAGYNVLLYATRLNSRASSSVGSIEAWQLGSSGFVKGYAKVRWCVMVLDRLVRISCFRRILFLGWIEHDSLLT